MLNPVDVLGQAFVDTGLTLVAFLPRVLTAMLLLFAGFLLASFFGRAVAHLVTLTRIDRALHKAGFDKLSEKAGLPISLAGFVGGIAKWFVIVASTLTAAEILYLTQITQLLRDILMYIPQVIVAAVVLVIAALLGDFVARLVDHSARAASMKGHFAAQVAKWSIIIVGGIFPALTQLRIAQGLVEVLFTGVVFALSLALGLAFGLGGRDAASRAIEKMK